MQCLKRVGSESEMAMWGFNHVHEMQSDDGETEVMSFHGKFRGSAVACPVIVRARQMRLTPTFVAKAIQPLTY